MAEAEGVAGVEEVEVKREDEKEDKNEAESEKEAGRGRRLRVMSTKGGMRRCDDRKHWMGRPRGSKGGGSGNGMSLMTGTPGVRLREREAMPCNICM